LRIYVPLLLITKSGEGRVELCLNLNQIKQ
jgi:hypothetical protein